MDSRDTRDISARLRVSAEIQASKSRIANEIEKSVNHFRDVCKEANEPVRNCHVGRVIAKGAYHLLLGTGHFAKAAGFAALDIVNECRSQVRKRPR